MSAKEERGTGAGGSVFNTAEEDDSKQKKADEGCKIRGNLVIQITS